MSTQTTQFDDSRRAARSTWAVSGLTLISRLLGFLRLILLVQLFAPLRWASDAFIFAFRIPNLFRNLLGEGALSAAFIPAFVKAEKHEGRHSAGVLGSQAFTLLTLFGGGVAVLGILVCLVIDGFATTEEVSLAVRLTALLFPFMPLICLAALLGGMLQSLRRFALPAAMSILLNLGFLAGFAYVYFWQCGGNLSNLEAWASTRALAVFVLAAGVLEVLVQLPALAASGVLVRPMLSLNHPGLREVAKAFLPVALGLGLVQVNAFADSLIAGWISLQAAGAVTYLEVAFRFVQLPLGVFGAAIATVSFPAFAASAAEGDPALLYRRLVRALRMSLFLVLPSAGALIGLADPIIRLACQRADLDFSHAAVYRASTALILYAAGLALYSVRQILVRAFYAVGEYRLPVKVAAIMVFVNIALNLTLIHAPDLYRMYFPEYLRFWNIAPADFPMGLKLGEAGLALSTCLTAVIDTAVLAHLLRKRLLPSVPAAARRTEEDALLATAVRMALTAVVLAVMSWLYRNSIPYDPGFLRLCERALVPGALAVGTFFVLGVVLPLPEMKEFLFGLFRRGKHGES